MKVYIYVCMYVSCCMYAWASHSLQGSKVKCMTEQQAIRPYACRTNGNDQFGLFRSLLLESAIKVILGVTFYTEEASYSMLVVLCLWVCGSVFA